MKAIRQLLKNSAVGYRLTGQKRKMVAEKLEALLTAKQVHKLVLFVEILAAFQSPRELQALSQSLPARQIKSYDGNRLNQILEFTFREYYRTITLKEVAALANLTPEAFCKYFKTRTRKTYTRFLNEIRINQACRLLMDDQPVGSVCYDCGFTNRSNFNRIFKTIKKTTPGRWRSQQLTSYA
jgi:AraC-like DNA-binding protein